MIMLSVIQLSDGLCTHNVEEEWNDGDADLDGPVVATGGRVDLLLVVGEDVADDPVHFLSFGSRIDNGVAQH